MRPGGGAAGVEHLHLRLVARPEDELRPGRRDANAVPEVARARSASKPSTIASGWSSRACSTRASGSSSSPTTSRPPSSSTRVMPSRATGSRFPIRARRDTPGTLVFRLRPPEEAGHRLGQRFCPVGRRVSRLAAAAALGFAERDLGALAGDRQLGLRLLAVRAAGLHRVGAGAAGGRSGSGPRRR